ncbi:MAG: MltA domain-containing protein [Cyanobacteria bacterium J06633_1]
MKKSIFALSLAAIATWGSTAIASPLKPIAQDRLKYVGLDDKLGSYEIETKTCSDFLLRINPLCQTETESTLTGWDESQRQALIESVDHSLYYLSTPKAAQSYRQQTDSKFNLARVRRSLFRFRELLLTTDSPAALEQAVKAEFDFYQSVGKDNRGRVEFTGYFEPTYTASRIRTAKYRYPLYRMPTSLKRSKRHPTRSQLEGKDGLASQKNANNPLKGHELVWLSDRLEAFLVQVQGSARLNLTDGTTMSVGYGGTTNYPYVSVGGELVKDNVFGKDELTLPRLLDYFAANPKQLDKYIPRNNRFIFFRETDGRAATGSLGVPVTGDRSIATDKSIMPPGALALIVAPIADVEPTGEIETRVVSRYVLDQDTGSAIKGAGRVDIFLGSGEVAGARAGLVNGSGNLFYLLLKE